MIPLHSSVHYSACTSTFRPAETCAEFITAAKSLAKSNVECTKIVMAGYRGAGEVSHSRRSTKDYWITWSSVLARESRFKPHFRVPLIRPLTAWRILLDRNLLIIFSGMSINKLLATCLLREHTIRSDPLKSSRLLTTKFPQRTTELRKQRRTTYGDFELYSRDTHTFEQLSHCLFCTLSRYLISGIVYSHASPYAVLRTISYAFLMASTAPGGFFVVQSLRECRSPREL